MRTEQLGYRGTGMEQVTNPRRAEATLAANQAPEALPAARMRPNAPTASSAYKNLQVLGDLSLAEFGRTMTAITAWVAGEESCAYCHIADDFADDSKYTKRVARRMLQMVVTVNTEWRAHVGDTGVTCYTCHRGRPLPAQSWFRAPPAGPVSSFKATKGGQNSGAPEVGYASLPNDVFERHLAAPQLAQPIRVAGLKALPDGTPPRSIIQTEATYGLMMHMSGALGVNCTFCHNSRALASWAESRPQRVTAWHGLQMVRTLNASYLDPLSGTFPEIPVGRLGPAKDAAKVHCGTCHRGVSKPLNGATMAVNYPAMGLKVAAPAAEAASQPPAATTADAAASAPGGRS